MSASFKASANAAFGFLAGLLRLSSKHAQRESMPSVLEMLTVCRETGCKLPELECYARAVDANGVVLLSGGSPELAAAVAGRLGLPTAFHHAENMPIMWWVSGGPEDDIHFRHGLTETRLSREALATLIEKNLGKERLITIHQRLQTESTFTFVWLPDPEVFELFADDPAVFELFLTQKLAIVTDATTPAAMRERLLGIGQFLLRLADNASAETLLNDLNDALQALHEMTAEIREERAAAMWSWLVPRLIEAIDRTKQQYALMIDKQQHKINATAHLLREYRKNWVAGIKNQADSYLQKKIRGPQFESFYDAKLPGPENESFLSAISVSGLRGKLNKSMTDRMAEFVAGLGALANKVELRQIPLKDVDTRWNPQKLNATIETALVKNKVFTQGGGPRTGLVGSLTGKSDEIVNTRKGQIARACRFVAQAIEADFAVWCDELMKKVEKLVYVQLAANLVNQGLPEADTLRTALDGLDRLAQMIQGEAAAQTIEPELIVKDWLAGLTARRFIPSYEPPPPA
ncbi:hypothetical protein KKC97_13955 [bacterium]|nr:hypothetical protein [bacterium]MBU1920989.1 hypothetical protein [bacterium]